MRSVPPFSANLAEIPVPAPAPTMGRCWAIWPCSLRKTSVREYFIESSRSLGQGLRTCATGAHFYHLKQCLRCPVSELRIIDIGREFDDRNIATQVFPYTSE